MWCWCVAAHTHTVHNFRCVRCAAHSISVMWLGMCRVGVVRIAYNSITPVYIGDGVCRSGNWKLCTPLSPLTCHSRMGRHMICNEMNRQKFVANPIGWRLIAVRFVSITIRQGACRCEIIAYLLAEKKAYFVYVVCDVSTAASQHRSCRIRNAACHLESAINYTRKDAWIEL